MHQFRSLQTSSSAHPSGYPGSLPQNVPSEISPQTAQPTSAPSTMHQNPPSQPPAPPSNSSVAPAGTSAESAITELESKVEAVFSSYAGESSLEMYFADITVAPTAEVEAHRRRAAVEDLMTICKTVSTDMVENVLRIVLRFRLRSDSAHVMVKETIQNVINQVLPLKTVCELLLTAPDCGQDSPVIWLETFEFLNNHISKLDYKGVRDVLKVLLERVQSMAVHLRPEQRPLVEVAEKLVAKVCDRKNNFLPAYFVVNEIKKNYPDHRCFPHWRLSTLFANVVDSFRPLAQMVSIVSRSQIVPVAGHIGVQLNTSWKMEPQMLRFPLKGMLPYPQELLSPQYFVVYHSLMQGGYRELLSAMFNVVKEKGRCPLLEDVVVSMILEVMAEGEREGRQFRMVWRLLAGLITYLAHTQYVSFARTVISLQQKLSILPYRKSRDNLIWCLLQWLVGGTSKATPDDFYCVLDLYRILYSGADKFTVSNADASIACSLAAACVWTHFLKRASQTSELDIPPSINSQIQFLQENLKNKSQLSVDCYIFAVLCNAYSTTTDIFSQELAPALVEHLENRTGTNTGTIALPGGLQAEGKCVPLKFEFLDATTIHVRMYLMQHIHNQNIMQYTQRRNAICLSPACVETYARLLTYADMESQGLKSFLQLPVMAVRVGCLEVVYIAFEILLYRITQLPLAYRVQVVVAMQQVCSLPNVASNMQLYCLLDNALFRLIYWCPPSDMLQQVYTRLLGMVATNSGDQVRLVDSEEIIKTVVFSVARALTIAGADNTLEYKDIISRFRAHSWPASTLKLFPPGLDAVYLNQVAPMSAQQKGAHLVQQIREEHVKWRTLGNDSALIEHFTRGTSHQVFLCLLYYIISSDNAELQPIYIKILEAMGPRTVYLQLQTLVDYIVCDAVSTNDLQRCADATNKLIWKYGVFSLDRFILTIVLRHYEGNEALVATLLTVFVLQRSQDLLTRIAECVNTLPADHWHCHNWHEKHLQYHQKFPERHWPIVLQELTRAPGPAGPLMPIYFGNACFSLIPMLDLVIQKVLDIPTIRQSVFDTLITSVGSLYRYHQQPVMFLYMIFRFGEAGLPENWLYRQKLLLLIHAAFCALRGDTWLVSADFLRYIQQQQQINDGNVGWLPDLDYFAQLILRLVDCMGQPLHMPNWIKIDWRFSEFPGCHTHALYVVCVELMALPTAPNDVGTSLINLILQGHPAVPRRDTMKWTNALGLIFTALPTTYLESLYNALTAALASDDLNKWTDVFAKLNVEQQIHLMSDSTATRLLAIGHAVWQHATIGYLVTLPHVVRERWRPIVSKETQFFYVCHLVGPFLQRLHQERSKQAMEVATDIYEMLLNVDKNISEWRYEDIVCDLLYHMKYMFVGDGIRAETDKVIPALRPSLQTKLRYISHHQLDTVGAPVSN